MLIEKQIEEAQVFINNLAELSKDFPYVQHKINFWKKELLESAQALDCYYIRNIHRKRLNNKQAEDILNKLNKIESFLKKLEREFASTYL